jgi:hypothetical protein
LISWQYNQPALERASMIVKFGVLSLCFATALVGISAQTPASSPTDEFYGAIRSGDIARVTSLVQKGIDVNVKERRGGATPLMHAAAIGSLDALQLLLDKGADVNARNAAGATALMWAATDLAKVRVPARPLFAVLLARLATIRAPT